LWTYFGPRDVLSSSIRSCRCCFWAPRALQIFGVLGRLLLSLEPVILLLEEQRPVFIKASKLMVLDFTPKGV